MAALGFLIVLATALHASKAATCGGEKFFEYKFTPLEVSPVHIESDLDDANGRCGTAENHCEIMIQLHGGDRCAENKEESTDKGLQILAPPDSNVAKAGEFSPAHIGWKTHSFWKLSGAESTPLRIQVCDKDPWLRGGNDQIIDTQHTEIKQGCKEHRFEDADPAHPWFIRYELCCRPINADGSKKTSSFGKTSTFPSSSFGGSTHRKPSSKLSDFLHIKHKSPKASKTSSKSTLPKYPAAFGGAVETTTASGWFW